jgi:hypothetical protein
VGRGSAPNATPSGRFASLGAQTTVCCRSSDGDLAAALSPSASALERVGVGASQTDVVTSLEMPRQLVAPSVTLDPGFGSEPS